MLVCKSEERRVCIENSISMSGHNCTSEMLNILYSIEKLSLREIADRFSVSKTTISRWIKKEGIDKRKSPPKYNFNESYFDVIDDEKKAYWIGFIWCDGYVLARDRGNQTSYEFKLSLAEQDKEHLEKLNNDLDGNYKIKVYKVRKTGFVDNWVEHRLYICNKHFAKNLYENFGLKANRHDVEKLINRIPEHLYRHFIRGVLDADGCIVDSYVKDRSIKSKLSHKINMSFYTYEALLDFIQEHFYKEGLISKETQYIKRHEGRDLYCTGLSYTGSIQVPRILKYLYENSEVYLNRKYNKYLNIVEKLSGGEGV